jgi:DNA-binding transcriptional LysR family regulator
VAGRLVQPFEIWLDEGFGYYLTTHPEDLSNEAVALFRSWLIARFARDKARDATPAAVENPRPKAVAAAK